MRIFQIETEDRPMRFDVQVPIDVQIAASEQLLEREHRLLESEKGLSLGLNKLREQQAEGIRSIVGIDAWENHRGRYDELLGRFREAQLKFGRTPAGELEENEFREHLKREKHELYHGIGFDTKRALATRERFIREARRLLEESLEDDAELPEDADTKEPQPTSNPWTWVFPAYSYQWVHTVQSSGSRGHRWKNLNASAASGQISLWDRMDLFGADDSDWSKTDIMAEVGFWFRMPAAGLVEAWIRYQDIDTDYTGSLWDESGCSDADIQQLSRVYMWTGGSTERYSTVVDYRRGESSGSWARGGPTHPGDILSRHFYSHRSYAANEWVYVAAGVRDMNYYWVDDMSCRSTMTSKWFVDHLAVRSTGAP